jgi:hypothetical protein
MEKWRRNCLWMEISYVILLVNGGPVVDPCEKQLEYVFCRVMTTFSPCDIFFPYYEDWYSSSSFCCFCTKSINLAKALFIFSSCQHSFWDFSIDSWHDASNCKIGWISSAPHSLLLSIRISYYFLIVSILSCWAF